MKSTYWIRTNIDISAYHLAELLGLEDMLPRDARTHMGRQLGHTQFVVAGENGRSAAPLRW